MPTNGPNNPTAAVQENRSGGTFDNWSNPTRALTTDASYATCTVDDLGSGSHKLVLSGFGFNFTSSGISGISVTVRAKRGAASPINLQCRIRKHGSSTEYTAVSGEGAEAALSTSDADYVFGSAADLFGTTFSEADIEGAGFSVVLWSDAPPSSPVLVSIDSVAVTVTYAEVAGAPAGTRLLMGVGS